MLNCCTFYFIAYYWVKHFVALLTLVSHTVKININLTILLLFILLFSQRNIAVFIAVVLHYLGVVPLERNSLCRSLDGRENMKLAIQVRAY